MFTIALAIIASCPILRADVTIDQTGDAQALAHQWSQAIHDQDATAGKDLLDVDGLYTRASAGIVAPDFKDSYKPTFAKQAQAIMISMIRLCANGDYHLLRVRQVNGETHVLFRYVQRGGGLNYHDWICGKDNAGNLKFEDVYFATSGELVSQTLHRVFMQSAVVANPGLLDQLRGKDREMASNLAQLSQMEADAQRRQYQKVIDDYNALPDSAKQEKNFMLARFSASEKLRKDSPLEYHAAMDDYKRLFPGDPSVDLDCLDGMIAEGEYADADKSLDRLEAYTGGDAYLEFLRGSIYKLQGGDENLDLARKYYQKAVDQEPTLESAYWGLVAISLNTQQYDQTASLLTQIEKRFDVKITDLTKAPSYAGFITSDAYRKWVAARSQNDATSSPSP